MSYPKYASIILEVAVDKSLDYGVGEELVPLLKRGMMVEVPVRGHLRRGYVCAIKETPEVARVHPIARIVTQQAVVSDELFDMALWMARYYCAPLRQIFKAILPASVRKQVNPKQQLYVMRAKTRDELSTLCQELRNKSPAQAAVLDAMLQVTKGILLTELLELSGASRSAVDALAKKGALQVDIVRIDRSPLVNEQYFKTKAKALNPDQAEALEKIDKTLAEGVFGVHLLFGVTGSGKTEVYLQAIDKALALGKGVIMLVPEISLTAQTIERFKSRLEAPLAVLHHRLSPGERLDEWERIRRGEARIVIGARSAIFSPVENLGLIIVDEEHESSYKQTDEAPCYNARDVAVMRGKFSNSSVILGSATPSLESYYNAAAGKYTLSKLLSRADAASIPSFTIVDMKKEFEKAKGFVSFSDPLLNGIKARAARGEQTILFLNRRGYHTTLFCTSCSKGISCNHCDTTLTFHMGDNRLSCHLCGFTLAPPPKECPTCRKPDPMKFKGVGTEQIERALHAVLPEIRTLRIDADTTRHKGSHQKLLRDFGSGKADVLIGTQMIAKGLHFPEVTLVGVLNCDGSLNIPDFRASEVVFQLVTQVAGRAGRGAVAGEVIVQTAMPENATLKVAAAQDYEQFYESEIAVREIFRYPPYSALVKFAFSGTHQLATRESAARLREGLRQHLSGDYELMPVIPCGHAKIKDKHRFQFLVRGPHVYAVCRALESAAAEANIPDSIRMLVDVNPVSTFF